MEARTAIVSDIIDDLRRIFQALTEQSKKVERETGLPGPQLWILKILNGASCMKVSDLARRMYLNPATMVGLVDRLEAKGLVTRTRCDHDRRVVNVALTPQGRDLVLNSPEVVQVLLVNGLENESEPRLTEIAAGLSHLVDILGVQGGVPKTISSLIDD